MKLSFCISRLLALAAASVAAVPFTLAQSVPDSPSADAVEISVARPRAEADTVTLSPFEVSVNQPARYQADEAASGGRIRTQVMDTPSTVTVLTNEFLEDVGGSRIIDAALYVAGVSEATFPNGLDAVNIRGFQSTGRRIDGFSTFAQANFDPAVVERMEIIMGPDALLSPTGVPGGTINLVTKRPQFTSGGYLKLRVGQYDANRIETDLTGPIGERFAYRVIAAVQDSEGYVNDTFTKSYLFSPSFTWQLAPQSQLTVRYEYYDAETSNLEGIPVDPAVGTDSDFRTLPGVPRDFNSAPDDKYAFRRGLTHALNFLFTSAVTDRLSVRLAGRIGEVDTPNSDFRWGLSTPGGSYNPFTGRWEGGTIWTNTSSDPAAPNWVSAPAPALSDTIRHQGTYSGARRRERDLQNDWSYIVDAAFAKSTTLLGFAYSYGHQNSYNNTQRLPDFTVPGFERPSGPPISNPITTDSRGATTRYQAYLSEVLELFNRRLVLSGGISHVSFNGFSGNKLAAATSTTVAGQAFPTSGSKATYNYGIVLKPFSKLSVYYGHSESAVPSGGRAVYEGTRPPFSTGKQDEVGLKVQLFENRLLASVAYYEIDQSAYSVFNPENLRVPPPPVLLPDLVSSREASGWEFQVTGNITPNLSVVASYADTRNRTPYGVVLRGSPEDSAAVFVRYGVTHGALAGLSAGIGANYSSKRAGDNPPNRFAVGSTPENPIPYQPSFYLPARTLTNAYVSYRRGSWDYRLEVTNLTDEDHYASLSRSIVQVGAPRAFSATVTYRF